MVGSSVSNPLVAPVQDSTTAMSGVPLLEDATGLKDAIESKNWAAVAIGAVGTALDVLTAVMDPFGAIFAAGVGWLIEHVGPLKEALNALTGDADQIAAQSQTWTNVAKELESVSGDLVNLVKNDLESWKGDAADAYRKQSDDTAALIASAQKGSEGAASGVKTAGEVVAAVRTLVRDTIADLVGHLISWALQVVFTLGIGMAWVVPQVVTAVAKTASKISQVTTRLVKALKALVPLLKKAGTLFEDAGKALKKLTGKVDGPKAPKVEKTPKDHVDGDGEIGGGGKDTWVCKTDPVDVARGNVVIDQVDLELPSPLVLERLHVSSYRAGRWFGPTWVSTVDQRLTVSGERVRCFSPDGTTQLYPLAAPEVPVSPLNGPRRPLTRHADGTYTQTDPIRGRELRFGALPGRGSAEFALLTITDAQGARVEADYDSRGVPVALRHSAGYRVEFETEGERVTAIHVADPGSEARVLVRRFGYSPEGHLTSEINASGLPQVYHYDDAGRVTGWQDRNGTWYRYVYDADGRCVRTVGDRGFYDGEFTYDTERRITVFTDSLGHPSEFHFSEAGQLVREVDQLGHVTAFEWDGDDHLRSRTDPLGRTNRFEYTAEGALSTVIRPDGSRARIATESDGTVTVTVAGQERSWQRVYPPGTAPDLTAAMAAPSFDQNAQLGSQPAPQPAAVPLPDVAPDLTGSVLERDLFGRPRVVTDRAGGRTRLDWTVEGQLAGRTGPLGRREEWRYDAEGNRVGQSSSPQRHTRFEFGPFGLPRVKVDSTGDRTAYEYDTELRTTRITEPTGRSWHYTYDAAGRLIEETDFDGRVLRFGYDAAGQLVRTVNGFGEVVTYAYDPLGNLVERASAAGTTTYAYDPVGLLTRAAGPGCVLEIERDERGRVVRESVNGRAVTYSHESRTLHRRTPSGVDSSWTFDDSGNAVSLAVAGHVVSFATTRLAGRSSEPPTTASRSPRPSTPNTSSPARSSPAPSTGWCSNAATTTSPTGSSPSSRTQSPVPFGTRSTPPAGSPTSPRPTAPRRTATARTAPSPVKPTSQPPVRRWPVAVSGTPNGSPLLSAASAPTIGKAGSSDGKTPGEPGPTTGTRSTGCPACAPRTAPPGVTTTTRSAAASRNSDSPREWPVRSSPRRSPSPGAGSTWSSRSTATGRAVCWSSPGTTTRAPRARSPRPSTSARASGSSPSSPTPSAPRST